jgi:hypothetical protein
MAVKGEVCPIKEYCGQFKKPQEITVYDCNYKSSQELCFKGLVFDVGAETMMKLRDTRRALEDIKISAQYHSNGDKI